MGVSKYVIEYNYIDFIREVYFFKFTRSLHAALSRVGESLGTVFSGVLLFGCAGFSGGKAEAQSADLSAACGTLQDDKVTAFRPVMKR